MRLGRLWAGFWRPQNSILEPPSLDFGASSLDFEASRLDWEPPGLQPSFAYASHIQQHHLANVGQSLAWGSFLLCFCLPQQPCQSVGSGGVPPWGPNGIRCLYKMASWGPSGSILEASGFHFAGSGLHFRRLWTSHLEPRTPRTLKNLQKQKLHHKVA